MLFKSRSKFRICGLNQEKILNEIAKSCPVFDIERIDKQNSTFQCSFFDKRKVEKILKDKRVQVVSVVDFGVAGWAKKMVCSYGLVAGLIVSAILYGVQSQYVLQYEFLGFETVEKSEVLTFLKENFSAKKSKLNTEEIEIALADKFDEISFVSCIVKGQTLVVNIKEKLLPEEKYGTFKPLVASKNGRVTQINLVSGTLNVKVGDVVMAGDVLVEPYTIDTSGNLKKVEAEAEIFADVYNEASVDHYETMINIYRTGKTKQENIITLFGLPIYTFKEDVEFEMYEIESENVDLVKNLLLPFKMQKITYYELEKTVTNSVFDDVKEEYVEKAKQKALEKCKNCGTINDEFYTIRHISNVTIVNYCIVTSEQIGGYE